MSTRQRLFLNLHFKYSIPQYIVIIFFYLFLQPVFAQSVPTNPTLSVNVAGTTVSLSWSADNADTYILYAAPYPDASVIYDFDMGTQTSASFDLPGGSAYYLAIRASNSAGLSGWSNIEHFDWSQNTSPSSPIALSKTQVSLESGNTETITISGGAGYYTVNTSNSLVATAAISGSSVEISGLSSGTATITVEDTGGATATISVTVTPTVSISCGAYVAPGVWKEFDCYNLAAIGKTTNDDPFTPSWRLIGGYWQWGRKGPDPSQWHNTNTEHFAHGPTGPGSSEANGGSISGWETTDTPDGSWSDNSKTANDSCPDGFRVPSNTQWEGVLANNTHNIVGSWSGVAANYSSARFFGTKLMLPAAGFRSNSNGSLLYRGSNGYYWSTTGNLDNDAWQIYFNSSSAKLYQSNRGNGFSVRCIADDSPSQPTALTMNKTNLTLVSGDSETISISGGTGIYTVSSSNSQVAIAVVSGNSLDISGLTSGTASIVVKDTGGETASISVTVSSSTTPSGNCGAYIAPGVWKEFDCYNLAAIGKTTNDDPFTPSWRLIGGYWQWGRKGPDPGQWYDTNTEHFAHGPTGSGDTETNEGEISIWDDTNAPNDSWSDTSKTSNDPCPTGYRVPTESQWYGVVKNNTQRNVGTWDLDYINYSSARFFGNDLMLPAAGHRNLLTSGALNNRGYDGSYWSSSESKYNNARCLFFSGLAISSNNFRRFGFSVRCVAE